MSNRMSNYMPLVPRNRLAKSLLEGRLRLEAESNPSSPYVQ